MVICGCLEHWYVLTCVPLFIYLKYISAVQQECAWINQVWPVWGQSELMSEKLLANLKFYLPLRGIETLAPSLHFTCNTSISWPDSTCTYRWFYCYFENFMTIKHGPNLRYRRRTGPFISLALSFSSIWCKLSAAVFAPMICPSYDRILWFVAWLIFAFLFAWKDTLYRLPFQ